MICNRPELQVDEHRLNVMPKAVYTLTKYQKRKISGWVKCLRFPDGYASNLARCVNMIELRLHGMKSHVCHIFMQKLIPIAFREMVPKHVWSALTEVSLLFQILCSTTLDVRKVQELEDSVAVIMCNLKKVFRPTYFDSMEHLNLHLSYEARLGEPVQYRWMYPFERWVDPTRGMKVDPRYHLVDVNFKQVEEELPILEVNTNNQTYDLHDPDVLQHFVDLTSVMQHGGRTSRTDEDD
ncbi:UNVERIFIED_CONTAM: hypothetical protein Scaly_2760100 [Sesamum calycinum]|uniref:DUF4218 domain-containing protein n=1 Tax=Sesamum calycinum TaxID=2727403 RepID=A0AAW2J0D2_9LAMI